MTQQDRDRLVALQKAKNGLITQRQAAAEIGQSERHIRRLLKKLKTKGDAAIVHGLRGRPSNRKLDEKTKRAAHADRSRAGGVGDGLDCGALAARAKGRVERSCQTCRDQAGEQRLHHPIRQQDLSDCARRHARRPAGRRRASRSPSRRVTGGTLPRLLPDSQRVSRATQSIATLKARKAKAHPPSVSRPKSQWMKNFIFTSPEKAALSGLLPSFLPRGKTHSEGRAKAARPSLAYQSPRPPLLRNFTKESGDCFLKPKPSGSGFSARGSSVADAFFGASPVVASALGIHLGATPRGRFHSKPSPFTLLHKPHISTWR
jgi:Helix-turn-helix domain